MAKQLLDPNQIIFIQSRAAINEEVIGDYTSLMKDGVQFDPASGILDETGNQVYVWDGAHRGEAAKRLKKLLAVNLQPGTREEAEWLALTANQKHGLRRSRADKQQAIRQALRHPRGVTLSNSEIARHCGVDHKTVGRIRAELETSGEIPRITERTVTRNGVTYQQETANLNQLQRQAGRSYEGACPHCAGVVNYDRTSGELVCEQCVARWPNNRALANETGLTDIDGVIRATLDGNDPKWDQAQQTGLSDQQLRDMIAQRWGRGSGQVNALGRGYWVTGSPSPALWIGRAVLDEKERGKIPTLDGVELLTAVRAALRLPHGTGVHKPHRYTLEEDQPQPCPECGEQRVRGVNGSQRWCIGCGASWPTAAAFLVDVATATGSATVRQEELTRRFTELVRHLSPAQLSEVEAVIMRLERQGCQLPMGAAAN